MILKNLIYILQSENYYFKRFLKFAYTHLSWWKLENRQKIVWTIKARLLWIIAAVLFWMAVLMSFLIFNAKGLFIIPFLIAALPFIIGISLKLLAPFDSWAKQKKINGAEKIISESGCAVIGIAGSYGKTSAKEILSIILEQKFRVIKTPENVNTDTGIANFIIKNGKKFTGDVIFIVEMGAYMKGEIEKICKMTQPSYSILTGINESHLERFGSLENIISGKFELVENTRKLALLNFDDENIKNNYSKYSSAKTIGISKADAENIQEKENFGGLKFEYQSISFETSLLAKHNIALILLCAKLAQELLMSMEEVRAGVKKIKVIEHRLQPIYNSATNVMVIDDSYNGNYNGILSGIKLLKRASGRKIVLTPGLVELGDQMEKIHAKIAKLYTENTDLVLLIKNKMTDCIAKELDKLNFKSYKIYKNTAEAHADLKNILRPGDTIIFQNDLTDNYF